MNGWKSGQGRDFLRRDERGRRGLTYKLLKTLVRLDIFKFSVGNRVCEQWNNLLGDVVSYSRVNIIRLRECYLRNIKGV